MDRGKEEEKKNEKKKRRDVKHQKYSLQVDGVRDDSNEEFKNDLPAASLENVSLINPTASSEASLIDQGKDGQKTDHEPQGGEEEQAQTSEEPEQQQNEAQLKDEEPLKNEQQEVREATEEPSKEGIFPHNDGATAERTSHLHTQRMENPNQTARRRGVGKLIAGPAAKSEATKQKTSNNETKPTDKELKDNEEDQTQCMENPNNAARRRGVGKVIASPAAKSEATKQTKPTDKEPKANEEDQKETKDRTIVYPQSTERAKQPGQRRGVVEEEMVRQQPSEPFMSTLTLNLVAGLLLLSVIYILHVPPKSAKDTDAELRKSIRSRVAELQSVFRNQTDSFWTIFKTRMFWHQSGRWGPNEPLVLSLAAAPSAYHVVDCMAKKLAEVLDPDHDFITLDGVKESNNPGVEVKRKINNLLREKFEAGHKVALVYRLELFPPPSHMMFHAFCDDQNAPYGKVAILFTVHLPREPDFPLAADKEAEETVEKYLLEVWSNDNIDTIESLLVRVAPTVLPVNRESTASVKALCP